MNVDGLDVDDVLLIVDCTIQVNEVHLDRLDALIPMYHEMCSSVAKFDSVRLTCTKRQKTGEGGGARERERRGKWVE